MKPPSRPRRHFVDPLVGKRVSLRDWTGTHAVDVLDLTTGRAHVRLEDGTELHLSRAKFNGALRRAERG